MTAVDAREFAAIFAGGFLGAVARVALGEGFAHDPGAWPWATFAVNVAGAALLGALLARGVTRRPFLGTGLCGGLTTFSAFQLELLDLLDAGHAGLAAAYAGGSVAAGLAAVAAATRLAR